MPPRKSKKRAYGTGSIYQQADGRFVAVISQGTAPSGKRLRHKVYGHSRDEVQLELERMNAEEEAGEGRTRSTQRVEKYLEGWLSEAVKPRVAPATYERYEQIVRLYVTPQLGNARLDVLTPLDIEGAYTALGKDDASPSTLRKVHATLRRAMNQAVRWGLVKANPVDRVDPPRYTPKPIRPLSRADARRFLKVAVDDRLAALYVLALTTAMREGELFALRRADLDLAGKRLWLRRSLRYDRGATESVSTKTKAGRRAVVLSSAAVQALRAHLPPKGKPDDLVFTAPDGGALLRPNFLRRSYYPLLIKAKLPRIRFHDLRHTTATLLLADNVHPKVVADLLGHSNITVTLQTYSHVMPEMHRSAVDQLSSGLRIGPAKPAKKQGESQSSGSQARSTRGKRRKQK